MRLALDIFTVVAVGLGLVVLSRRHARAAALPRHPDPPACTDEGGQPRPRADRAGTAAPGVLAAGLDRPDRGLAARPAGRGHGRSAARGCRAPSGPAHLRSAGTRPHDHRRAGRPRPRPADARPGRVGDRGLDHLPRGGRLRRLRARRRARLGSAGFRRRGADGGRARQRLDRPAAAPGRRTPAGGGSGRSGAARQGAASPRGAALRDRVRRSRHRRAAPARARPHAWRLPPPPACRRPAWATR